MVLPSFKADVPEPLPSGRLPPTARPVHYALELRVDPSSDRFSGQVRIDVVLERSTSAIVLHGSGLDVGQVEIASGARVLKAQTSFRKAAGATHDAEELLLLALEPIAAGPAQLRLSFSGPLESSLRGIYRVSVGADRYVFTQFEPSDARRMLPCFDDPAYKVPFDVAVTVPKGNLVIANGRELGRAPSADGAWTTFTFATTPPIPTYLLALAAGPFEVRDGPNEPIPIRIITARGKAHLGTLALDASAALVRILAEYFDRPFPYEKLDLLAVPDFGPGAMENAGLIASREELLLVDADAGSPQAKRAVAAMLAHELVHQWFGDLVTMAWWDELWLNEGFATNLGAWAMDRYAPGLESGVDALASTGRVMDFDALESVRAVRNPVSNTYQALEAFDGITYLKGAAVLSMLRSWLGEAHFRTGIRAFLKAHEWASASSEDLFRALSEASGKDVGPVASTFLDQVGVPIVRAELRCPPGERPHVVLTQKRYRPGPSAAPSARPEQWKIPVCVEYGSARDTKVERSCALLGGPTAQVDLPTERCPAWLKSQRRLPRLLPFRDAARRGRGALACSARGRGARAHRLLVERLGSGARRRHVRRGAARHPQRRQAGARSSGARRSDQLARPDIRHAGRARGARPLSQLRWLASAANCQAPGLVGAQGRERGRQALAPQPAVRAGRAHR